MYLFVGCPHGNKQQKNLCKKFGIYWFENFDMTRKTTTFKNADDLLLITDTYVKGFAIDHHRLFFSIQRNKTDNSTVSRVANVCQKLDSAPNTYVDMELKCGDFNYLQAVAKRCFEEECIIVATFTQGEHSVVCAYRFSEIKSSLAVNVKRCYNKTLQLPSDMYDYFHYPNYRPCTGDAIDLTGINATDDYFLCNEYGFSSLKDVIGDTAQQMNASVRLNHTVVTALTLVSTRGRVLALLGTAEGEIIKALVYPREAAMVLPWSAVVDSRHAVLSDMIVCTTSTECSNSQWILAEGSASFCPQINQTCPSVIRTDEYSECSGVDRGDEVTVMCSPPDWTELEHYIKGTASLSVLLFTNVSSKAVMRGELTVFECETFTRCGKCSFSRWTCKWCPLEGRCIKDNNSCNGNESSEEIDEKSSCPRVTNYSVSAPNILDGSGDAHLAIEESYNITIKGVNFIE
ncbi:hypothetical protein MAR_012860, partial [Mya arenaria]